MNKAVRYDIRGKRILTRSDKYYLTDLGLSKINNTGFKTEIDFVVMDGDNRSYYQVAYLLADDMVVQREFGAFNLVDDNFPKYVLSMDKYDFSREGIKHINILD